MRTEHEFWANVDVSGPCWRWTLYCEDDGRGQVNWRGKTRRAHAVAFEIVYGSLEPGMEILHSCDNSWCLRPSHMRAGTHAENMREMAERGRTVNVLAQDCAERTHCPHGHLYNEKNTYRRGDGSRGCRECRNEASRRCRRKRVSSPKTPEDFCSTVPELSLKQKGPTGGLLNS